MIKKIVENYQAVFVFAIMITIVGLVSYFKLPRESAPEIRRPLIFVTTIYPGVSAKDIESLITEEIEAELDGVTGLDKLTSTSSEGMSRITAEFLGDVDVETALRRIQERVDLAKPNLPEDAEDPMIKELNFSDQPIFIVNISNPNGLETLEDSVDFFEEEIEKIPGVLDVNISGKLTKEVEISLSPTKMRHYGFSLDDVRNAVRNENITIPGGTLKNVVQNYSLSVSGEIKEPKDFEQIVVTTKGGKRAKLKDLGTVAFRYKDPDTYNRMNGEPAISIAVTKRSGENMIRIVDDIKSLLERHKHELPAESKMVYSFDQSKDVEAMVKDLENNIFSGLVLVLVVTLFFLGPINATFVSLGIPFSMLISFIVLNFLGITLNVVVLFSLVLALGMLVDNGIVIVENIYRHRSLGASRIDAAISGTSEVALPIATSTLTTILAFFPIIFMPGIMGEFMQYLPKTVIIVLTSSLLVGITITTVFCSRFLRIDEKSQRKMTDGSGFFHSLQDRYVELAKKILAKTSTAYAILGISFVIVITGIAFNSIFGREAIFFPKLDPRIAKASITAPAGTPLEVTDKITRDIERIIPTAKGSLEHVQATSGTLGGGRSGLETNKANIRIGFKPFLEREVKAKSTIAELQQIVRNYPNAEVKVQEIQGGPPSGHDVSYEISGTDYRIMGQISEQLLSFINEHKAAFEDIDSDYEAVKPEIEVQIDRERAAYYGLNTRLIASSVRSAMNGSKVSTFRQGKNEYDVIMRYNLNARNQLTSLEQLEIVKDDKRIPLATVANIGHKATVTTIKRRERKRAVSVWADFKPNIEQKSEIKNLIDQKVSNIKTLPGYGVRSGEGQRVREESAQFLMQAFLVALLLIFIVLVLQFNSVTQPLIILISVFLSLGGVFWGLLVSQKVFVVIMSGIGTISLAGVVVNNAIVLIDFINQLRQEGYSPKDAVIEGGRTRLRPVLLTAITTVIGLLPMALGISLDFHEFSVQLESESSSWWAPMAWAIIFGLSFATILTLFVVPALMYLDLTKEEQWETFKQRLRSLGRRYIKRQIPASPESS